MKPHALLLSLGFFACGCDTSGSDTSGGPDGGLGGKPKVVLDGGGDAATPPDGASACPNGICNYQTNEGCTAGQGCVPLLNGTSVGPACNTVGTKQNGEA